MIFDNFDELHNYIRRCMTDQHTNIALIDIDELDQNNHIYNETYIVTMNKKSGELNFFSKCGVQMSWLSFDGALPCCVKLLEVKDFETPVSTIIHQPDEIDFRGIIHYKKKFRNTIDKYMGGEV